MISPSTRMIADKEGPIGWMVFNNPERRNALSLDMWEAIPPILDHFDADPEVRVVVLRGAGDKAFVSGADISQFEAQRSSPETIARFENIAQAALARLQGLRKPTIAMIRGFCIRGGLAVALQCDLRLAAEGARLGIPAARLGLGYRWGGIKRLVDVVGPANAMEIFFTARHFTAAEALGMGLVNRALPEGELESYVRNYCQLIAENAPLTLEAVKGIVNELARPSAEIDRARCEALVTRCFDSQDYIEGRRAFMEKRRPVFTGK